MKTWYCYFKSFLYVAVDFKKAKIVVREMAESLTLNLVDKGFVTDHLVLTVIYDVDNDGIESSPATNEVYQKTYELFLSERNIYAEKYNILKKIYSSF